MPVAMPTWDEFMTPMLLLLADGELRSLRELREGLASALTDEQRAEILPSGSPKSANRIGWAASYLSRVGAVDRPTRGQYAITELGRQLLKSHPEGLTERSLRAYAREGDRWWSAGPNETAVAVETTAGLSLTGTAEVTVIDPIEQIETGVTRIHAAIAVDLLDRLHAQDPAFLEQAVLDLLMAMGYGGAEGTSTRTQLSNDGGIDGIIDQDALGLSRIYVQAKRYGADKRRGPRGDPSLRRRPRRQSGQPGRLHHHEPVRTYRCRLRRVRRDASHPHRRAAPHPADDPLRRRRSGEADDPGSRGRRRLLRVAAS